jgi:hypothetical protein
MATPNLVSYVDHAVLLKISSREGAVTATLRSVDEHGLWLESEELTNELLGAKRPAGAVTPILFTPFVRVEYVIGALNSTPVIKE